MAGERARVYLLFAGLSIIVVSLDQATKWWVSHHPALLAGERIPVIADWLNVHFDLVLLYNKGAAWGMFSGKQYLLAAVSLVVFAGMLVFYRAFTGGWREREWAIGGLLGGIIGNFIDRIWQPGVIDFLRFYYDSPSRFFEWPSFNIADSAIVVGVGVYMISSFVRPEHAPGATSAVQAGEAAGEATTAADPATPSTSSTPSGTPRP